MVLKNSPGRLTSRLLIANGELIFQQLVQLFIDLLVADLQVATLFPPSTIVF